MELGGHRVKLVKRSRYGDHKDRYSIRRLLSPKDEAIDLADGELIPAWKQTLEAYQKRLETDPTAEPPTIPSGPAIRAARSVKRGLLLIYPLDWMDDKGPVVDAEIPIVGFGLSFPGSKNAVPVTYMVNNVYYTQEVMAVADE
jgi:hypothetical protein